VGVCSDFFPLSILRNGQRENAPTGTASTGPNIAHIFDFLTNASTQHPSPGQIPLHLDQPNYSHGRYWRLPKTILGGMLSAAVLRAINTPTANDEWLEMLMVLHSLLTLGKRRGVDVGLSGDAGPSGEGGREDGGGGGPGRREGGRGGGRGGKVRRGTPRKRTAEEEGNTRITRFSDKRHRC
jgi:hypothetical protein